MVMLLRMTMRRLAKAGGGPLRVTRAGRSRGPRNGPPSARTGRVHLTSGEWRRTVGADRCLLHP
eukprot:scaffold2631_cov412-Prasinococcus_capsulatus_cf.AAC.23